MSQLSQELLDRLMALDLVGFVTIPAGTDGDVVKSGLAKNGVGKAGNVKTGATKPGRGFRA